MDSVSPTDAAEGPLRRSGCCQVCVSPSSDWKKALDFASGQTLFLRHCHASSSSDQVCVTEE